MRTMAFVESYFDAWNLHDARLVAEHLTVDGTYCDIPIHEQHTRDELLGSLTGFFAANHHHYQLLGEVLKGNSTIAFQYRVSQSERAADGFFGSEFMTIDGDGAIRILDYYSMPGQTLPADDDQPLTNGDFTQKYTKSGLSESQLGSYKQRLAELMDVEMTFLKPDLTLPALAACVDCSVNHLSQVINSGYGMSFFDYLNHHRVDYAKQLLSNQEDRLQSVLSIALAAGFNSNSSFYTAFKKASGQTPAQFRQSQAT